MSPSPQGSSRNTAPSASAAPIRQEQPIGHPNRRPSQTSEDQALSYSGENQSAPPEYDYITRRNTEELDNPPPDYSLIPHSTEIILDRGSIFTDTRAREELVREIFGNQWSPFVIIFLLSGYPRQVYALDTHFPSPRELPHLAWNIVDGSWDNQSEDGVWGPDEVQVHQTVFSWDQVSNEHNQGNDHIWNAYYILVNPRLREHTYQLFPNPRVDGNGITRYFGRYPAEPGSRRRAISRIVRRIVSRNGSDPVIMLSYDE